MSTTVTILAILIVSLCPCQGECPIECFCDQTTICSGDKILTRLPQVPNWNDVGGGTAGGGQIPITRLELSHFLFEHLDKNSLLHLISSNLTELRLTNNAHLISIDNDTFCWPNDSVGGSAEEYKSISSFGPHSTSPPPPQHTDESGQKVPTLLILNLRTLDLSGNSLKYFVAGGRLQHLRVLDLSSNRLQQVYKLDHLHALESVNLRDNQILFLEGTLFQNLGNLQYINLDSNKIGHLNPTTFSNLPSLAHLILSSNPIENLLPGFVWNSRVQSVDVSRVGLDRIPTSLTRSVRDFRCAHNHLTIIRDSDFESYPNVGLLVLDENSIETVVDDAFGRLDFLARLWINGNRLSKVPQNLPPSLQSLQLENNIIVNISSVDFKNLRLLTELNLAGNKITAIPASTFSDLINLRHLNLRSNLVDTIEKDSLANLTQLETLDISQNPIKVIVNGVFNHVPVLSTLHMSGLQEQDPEFNPQSLYSLANLEILDLNASPFFTQKIIMLLREESTLNYFSSLVELDIQGCDLHDLHLVSSAILDSSLFDSLRSLKLGGNPWVCSNGTGDDYQEFIKLYHKNIIVDLDQMICANPFNHSQERSVLSIAKNVTTHIMSVVPKTRSKNEIKPNASPIKTRVKKVINNNNSRTHDINYTFTTSNFTSTTSLPTTSMPANKSKSHLNASQNSTIKPAAATTTATTAHPSTSETTTATTTSTKTSRVYFTDVTVSSIQEKPTRSYFEDQTPGSTAARIQVASSSSESGKEEKTLPIRHKVDGESRWEHQQQHNKVFSLRTQAIDDRDEEHNMEPPPHKNYKHEAAPRTNNNSNNKTNNDNAIIDEERNPKSSKQQLHQHQDWQGQRLVETVGEGSIDGFSGKRFPAFHPHDDSLPSDPHTTSSPLSTTTQNFRHPKSSYLKSLQLEIGRGFENEPLSTTTNGTLILKTLIVSALVCLLSILFLLLLSFAICRFSFSSWRSKTRPFPIEISRRRRATRKWDMAGVCEEEEEDADAVPASESDNTMYQTWNPYIHRGPTGMSYTRLGDRDTIELSGIPNRLYFENEEIYHIT